MALRANLHIQKALQLARELTFLADQGEADAQDDGCHVLSRIVLDCAYRIREQAERERDAHKARGIWDPEGTETVVEGRHNVRSRGKDGP